MFRKTDFYLLSLAAFSPLAVLFLYLFGLDLSQLLLPGLPSMVPLTAICILLAGASVWACAREVRRARHAVPALTLAAIALGVLAKYLFTDASNQQIPGFFSTSARTAGALFAIAASHLLLFIENFLGRPRARRLYQILNIIAMVVAALAILGYLYQITHLFGLSSYIGMSVLTAISVLALGVLSLRRDREFGLVRVLRQDDSVGYFARVFVFGGLLAPFVAAGLIRLAEVRYGLDANTGMAAFIFLNLSLNICLAILTARSFARVEAQKIEISVRRAEIAEVNETGRLREKFLANMSHEVRTPLTAVLGYLDFLDAPDITPAQRADFLIRAKRSAKTLLRVLDDILDLSKLDNSQVPMSRERISLPELLQDTLAQFYLSARQKGVELKLVQTAIPEFILTDMNRLQQILTNLLSNAVKFTEHGEVTVQVSAAENMLRFEVRDTGIGIPGHAQAKLFTNFYQVDDSITRRFGGSGIGLALSRKLAGLLDGKLILLASDPRRGSAFLLEIPYDEVAATAPKPAPVSHALESILLVEDNEDNRLLIARYVAGAAAQIDTAENGQIGVQMAAKCPYSVILMDVQMPVMGGLEATRALRELGYEGAIIALSAHASEEHRQRSFAAGCDAHLTKPIHRTELIAEIHRLAK